MDVSCVHFQFLDASRLCYFQDLLLHHVALGKKSSHHVHSPAKLHFVDSKKFSKKSSVIKKKELTKSYKISTQQKGDVANEFCFFNPWHLVKFQPPGPWPWTWLYTPTCPQLPHLSVAVGAGRVKERPYMSLAAHGGGEVYPILGLGRHQHMFIPKIVHPSSTRPFFQFRLLAPHYRFFDPRNPPIRGEILPMDSCLGDHKHFLHLT